MMEKGLSAQSKVTVDGGNVAATMGSGDLQVFATPAMVALMNVTHIKPSGVGAEIVASAVLTEVEGRKLTFNVGARDAEGMIGEGVHVRYVVDREKFMSKVR